MGSVGAGRGRESVGEEARSRGSGRRAPGGQRMESSMGSGAPAMDTAGLAAAVRHRWWVVALLALLGIAAAVGATYTIPATYEATTTLLVTPTGAEDAAATIQGSTKEVNLETEAQIVTSAAVAERVRETLGSPRSAAELAGDISVEVPPNTTLLSITAVAESPQAAQKESRTFA